MNLPNKLTIMRLAAVPLIIAVYYWSTSPWPCVAVFIIAGLTDWLDGYAARQSNQVTAFGAFLDPVADKLLVVTILILLMTQYRHILLTVAGIIIISRELLISALREWLARESMSDIASVSVIAKAKTAFQMLALTLLLAANSESMFLFDLGMFSLFISLALSVLSLIKYVKIALPVLTFSSKQE